MIKINFKKIILYILIIVVAFLVITAFYYNRYKFSGITTTRYTRVSLEYETNINELADKYSNNITKSRFVSEIKRINDIDISDYIPGNSTIIIPIIEFE
jgi:cell division protein FtsL